MEINQEDLEQLSKLQQVSKLEEEEELKNTNIKKDVFQDINLGELEHDFEQLDNFLNSDSLLESSQLHQNNLISSFEKEGTEKVYSSIVSNSDGNIKMKRVPENSNDILPIIQNIHLNNHLLAFFVKYQRFFYSVHYYGLLQKLKHNVDDIDYIRKFETEKLELIQSKLDPNDPASKPKYPLQFLDTEQTKKHFGYNILVRNLTQKFEVYDTWKWIQIMKALMVFDKHLSRDIFEQISSRFMQEKESFTSYELIQYQFILAQQSENEKKIVNSQYQLAVVEQLLSRNESEFTQQILNQIAKLRVIFPMYTIYQTNMILSKFQNQILLHINSFPSKQLLEMGMIFLTQGLHFQKQVADNIFSRIKFLLSQPNNSNIKLKVVTTILKFFQKRNLYYLQKIETSNVTNENQVQSQQYQANIQSNEIESELILEDFFQQQDDQLNDEGEDIPTVEIQDALNKQKQDSQTKIFKNFIRVPLKIEGLFELLLNSVVKEIERGSQIKPFNLHMLVRIIILNQVQDQYIHKLLLKEFNKILPKSSFLMFAKIFHLLSDQGMLSKQLHLISLKKIKFHVKHESVSYMQMRLAIQQQIRNNMSNKTQPDSQLNSNFQKILRLLLMKLNFSVSNMWSYVLNNVRFNCTDQENYQNDVDILKTGIIYCNNIIDDIVKYIDEKNYSSVAMNLIITSQQINNYIELYQHYKYINYISIAKLVSNKYINIIDGNRSLHYSCKSELLFELHKRYFQVKYNDYIQKNVLVKELIFEIQLQFKEQVYNINYLHQNHFTQINFQDNSDEPSQSHDVFQQRGIGFLKDRFAFMKKINSSNISYFDFMQFLHENKHKEAQSPNYVEHCLKLQLDKLKLSKDTQDTLELFQQQISNIFKESHQEIDSFMEMLSKKTSKNRADQEKKDDQSSLQKNVKSENSNGYDNKNSYDNLSRVGKSLD